MSVTNDLNTMTKMAGKGVFHDTTRVQMYSAYVLALILIASDEVASANSKSKSQLMSDDLLHSPTYQYCVEATKFLYEYPFNTIKIGVLFYASAVLFMHQDKNTIGHWHRVAPNEINAPKVWRYVARTIVSGLSSNQLLSRMSFPSSSLAFCLASFLETNPDTYDSISDSFSSTVIEYMDVDTVAPFLTAYNNLDECTTRQDEDKAYIQMSDNPKHRIKMELALQCDGVAISLAAQSMIRGWYKEDPKIELGNQPQIVMDLIEHEALRRGLLFTERDFTELHEFGFTTTLYGDTVDVSKLFEVKEEAK